MTQATFHALLSHWWRNPMQLFTLLAGLALATALWSGVQAINVGTGLGYALMEMIRAFEAEETPRSAYFRAPVRSIHTQDAQQ